MKFNPATICSCVLAIGVIWSGSSLQAAESLQRYQDECSECHGDANEFALDSLEFKDGKLMAMGAEKPVAEFLEKHRKLTAQDVDYYVELLTRVAKDAGVK